MTLQNKLAAKEAKLEATKIIENLKWRKPEDYDPSKYDWVLAHVKNQFDQTVPIPFVVIKIKKAWYTLDKSPAIVVDWRPIEPEREQTGYAAAMMEYKIKLKDNIDNASKSQKRRLDRVQKVINDEQNTNKA